MGKTGALLHLVLAVLVLLSSSIRAENPYKFYEFHVTYGKVNLHGFEQQVILINDQFPGPTLDVTTNDNVFINVFNYLDEPFLLTWNGIKQRKNSWEDGVLGTNCPIPPNKNYTYKMQMKDQIGTYTYSPSSAMHRAFGGHGALNVHARAVIAVPYAKPEAEFNLLIGELFKYTDHKELKQKLDSGKPMLPFPSVVHINGQEQQTFTGDQYKTYMFRISNVGLKTSFNVRFEKHTMTLVEVEGSHVVQNDYTSLDVHVGQSITVLVTLNQPPKDYYIVASTRFIGRLLNATAVLHYSNSKTPVCGIVPPAPRGQLHWSVQQARSIRWNLTANAARPNPQGSYHYGGINITKTYVFANSAPIIDGKQRYAINNISYINPTTPLKLADALKILGVFTFADYSIDQYLSSTAIPPHLATYVLPTTLHDFVEIVFQNSEKFMQTMHLDGYDFWVVAFGSGKWTEASRKKYNLHDAPTRHTTQVYPNSWTTILVSLDNKGMWNLRSAMWERTYLGQQLYFRVYNEGDSPRDENPRPSNALLCGKADPHHR
ncbi:unnamed protein product [Cuscuta europaea]|uniref:Uncharacterized protein n=1 Tax=Cuscuta europaea TaxID=41803 RepID=A0A9P0YMK3_CUSEU|nr:unnamed protein product [Cuscuta europaea]